MITSTLPPIRPVVTRIHRHRGTCPCRARFQRPVSESLEPGSPFGPGIEPQLCLAHPMRDAHQAIDVDDTVCAPAFKALTPRAIATGRFQGKSARRPSRTSSPQIGDQTSVTRGEHLLFWIDSSDERVSVYRAEQSQKEIARGDDVHIVAKSDAWTIGIGRRQGYGYRRKYRSSGADAERHQFHGP